MKHRGFSREDALNRISSQVDREERLSKADFVIDNNGDLDSLENEIDKVWSWIKGLSA